MITHPSTHWTWCQLTLLIRATLLITTLYRLMKALMWPVATHGHVSWTLRKKHVLMRLRWKDWERFCRFRGQQRDNARNNARCMQARKAMHGLDGQHQDMDRTLRGKVNQNDRRQGQMEKVRPWCGQPSDRGRLKNRTEQICHTTLTSKESFYYETKNHFVATNIIQDYVNSIIAIINTLILYVFNRVEDQTKLEL